MLQVHMTEYEMCILLNCKLGSTVVCPYYIVLLEQ